MNSTSLWAVRGSRMARAALGLALVALMAGCSAQTPAPAPAPVAEAPCPARDEAAQLVTIAADLSVDMPVVHLSRSAMDAAQWRNDSEESVTILFHGEVVGLEIPAHSFSPVHRVNPDIEDGSYPYTVRKSAGGPPTTPQFDIGP